MPDTTVHWYQAESNGVESWEFQFIRGGGDTWEWASPAGPVETCEECFQVPLELPTAVASIRARAIGPEGISEWGSPTGLPESAFLLMLVVGVLAIAALKR